VADPQVAGATLDALEHHLCVLDANGCILMVNRAWRRFAEANLSNPASACEGADYLAVCDSASGQDAEIARAFGAGIRDVLQGNRADLTIEYACHSPAEQRWFRATVSRFVDSSPARLVILHENITTHRQREAILRQLSAGFLGLQDDERRRFARELHDSTAQKLAAIIIGLGLIEDELSSEQARKARRLVADCLAAAEACAADIRSLSARLHPPLLDELGLEAAMEAYVHGLFQRENLHVMLEMDPNLGTLPKDLALALFRVVQECLANVVRHSGSNAASVDFVREGNHLVLTVADQGRGIPGQILTLIWERQVSPGLGILRMRERLELVGGTLEIDASPRGTTVRAIVPLLHPNHEDHPHPAS
jgi:signal transduction histidine kinase